TYEKMTEMLTKPQRERLKGLQGKVFWGKVDVTGPEVEVRPSLYPSELFGTYDFELRYSASARIRTELELSAEQQEKLSVAADDWDKEYQRLGLSVERAGELHERTAKALDDVLTPKQRARFHQLMARRRLLIGGPEAACCYPAAIDVLKITPIQLRLLKERKTVADVLTRADLAALEAFLGQPLRDLDDVNDPILARFTRAKQADAAAGKKSDPFTPLARSFLAISNILKLSDKQITRLRELAEDEPKIMELIQKELDFSDTPPVLGAARSLTSANAVTGLFKAAIEE